MKIAKLFYFGFFTVFPTKETKWCSLSTLTKREGTHMYSYIFWWSFTQIMNKISLIWLTAFYNIFLSPTQPICFVFSYCSLSRVGFFRSFIKVYSRVQGFSTFFRFYHMAAFHERDLLVLRPIKKRKNLRMHHWGEPRLKVFIFKKSQGP